MTTLLSIEGLTLSVPARSGSRPLLDGVDLVVRAGSSVALVGESGSGKSLTLRSILRLFPRRATVGGRILFDGQSVLDLDKRGLTRLRRTQVAMIFQDPRAAINPVRSIGDYLVEGLRTSRDLDGEAARNEAARLLDVVGVARARERLRQFPHEFSGGMLQRVMIAGAIGSGARLLLADEPTTALDVSIQSEIMGLLGDLRGEFGLSVVFVTHDIDLAVATCDRVDVMYAGTVAESRPSSEIQDGPRHPYSAALIGCRPLIAVRSSRLPTIPGVPSSAAHSLGRCAFETRCQFALQACGEGKPEVRAVGAGYVRCIRADELATTLRAAVHPKSSELPDVGGADVVVAADGLRKAFHVRGSTDGHVAVDDVTFAVRRGETLGIVGESGSGKTTLARLLLGLEEFDAGTVEVCGEQRTRRPRNAAQRRHWGSQLQMVFQDPYTSLDPRQTPRAAVLEILGTHRSGLGAEEKQSTAEELLEAVGLDARQAVALPSELSGGQRQRVAIAKALAAEPAAIILDEAVSALDVSIQAQVLNLLSDIQQATGVACLFISHDLSVIRQVAHRVIVMQGGRVVEQGTAMDVLSAPQHEYTQRLLRAVPVPGWRPPSRPA